MRRWISAFCRPLVACSLALCFAAGCAASTPAPDTLPLGDDPTASVPSVAHDHGHDHGHEQTAPSELIERPDPITLVVEPDVALAVLPVFADVNEQTHLQSLDLLHEGLTRWDLETGSWAPALATDVSVSADGLVWTFELDPAATFSDGTAITAADVVRSIDIVRGVPGSLAAVRLVGVTDLTATGNRVELELDHPDPAIPAVLSNPIFGIVHPEPEALDGSATSGAYTLLDGAFFPRDDDRLPVIAVVDNATGGDIMMGVFYKDFDEVRVPALVETHFAFNVNSWKLADPDRRALIASAVDQDVLREELPNASLPVESLVPGAPSCDSDCADDLEPTTSTLPEIFVDYVADVDDGFEGALAEELAAQLRRAGVPAQPRAHTLNEFVELIRAGEHEIFRTGWVGLVDEAESRLAPYGSDDRDNVSGYASDEFDAALAAARSSGDAADYERAAAILDDDVVAIPVSRREHVFGLAAPMADDHVRPDGTVDIAAAFLD